MYNLLAIFTLLMISFNVTAENNWSVGAALGAETHDLSHQIQAGDVELQFDPADSGSSATLSIGYQFHKNWFTTVEYNRFDLDEVEVENFYASINYLYRFSDSAYSGYVGILAGQSELDWQDDPIIAVDSRNRSEENLWGARAGLLADLNETWRLNLSYRYINASHETQLLPLTGSSEIEHKDFHSLSLGIEVRF